MLHMMVRENVKPHHVDVMPGLLHVCKFDLICCTNKLFMDLNYFRGLPRIDRRHCQRWAIIRFRESSGNPEGMQFTLV